MINRRTEDEIKILREANQIVAHVLATLAEMVEPGVSTGELDAVAESEIRRLGGLPAFLGYRGYPKTACISVDEVVVHGVPGTRKLKDGQIVSIDVGVKLNGYYGDAAVSIPCGNVDKKRQRLLKTTDRALASGIAAARAGNRVSDISRAVERVCKAAKLSVVHQFVGHGVGEELHEAPQIPNVDTGERGALLRPGMVLAIEPMVNLGVAEVRVLADGWTAVTADGKPSAHFEHSVVVGDGEAEILSATPKLIWGKRT